MPLILCRRKGGRRSTEGRGGGRAGGSTSKGETRRLFVKAREMKSVHMASVCIRTHIMSSAADNL